MGGQILIVTGIKVFGGIVLNSAVGGINPNAVHPTFMRFLRRILGSDETLVAYVQK